MRIINLVSMVLHSTSELAFKGLSTVDPLLAICRAGLVQLRLFGELFRLNEPRRLRGREAGHPEPVFSRRLRRVLRRDEERAVVVGRRRRRLLPVGEPHQLVRRYVLEDVRLLLLGPSHNSLT